MKDAVLMGPFIGEMYWEAGRFAPMLPYFRSKKYRGKDVKYIVLTRKERFDLYGRYADILVPLKIQGDYVDKQPNCFRLNSFSRNEYHNIAKKFLKKYKSRFNVLEHVYPSITKKDYVNKNQYPQKNMIYQFKPRAENYRLVNDYLSKNNRPVVILAPRFRKGFKRNWGRWQEFYDLIFKDKDLFNNFSFVICGKRGEYVPDKYNRFLDMNKIETNNGSSTIGLLLVLMEKAVFVCGSQSAIPNIGLLYKVEVLEFGCQRSLHTRTYNVHNSPITFIDNRAYNIEPNVLFNKMKKLLKKHKVKEK